MAKEGYYECEFEWTRFTARPSVWFDQGCGRWRSVFSQKFVAEGVAEEIVFLTNWNFEEMKKMTREDWRTERRIELEVIERSVPWREDQND